MPNFGQVTRVEVIDNKGRSYVKYGVEEVVYQLQDNDKTLKLFIRYQEEEEIMND
jgi:hypothetical protein